MTWTKLGAEWPDEARDLSDAAYRLHVDALCYSNRRLLDLQLPKRDLRRFAESVDPETASAELADRKWWDDRGDCWWIGCRFPEWQRSKEQVESKHATDARAQHRKRLHDAGDHRECQSLSKCSQNASSPESAHDSSPESAGSSERNGTASIRESSSGADDPRYWKSNAEMAALSSAAACSVCSGPLISPLDVADGVCVGCENLTHRRRAAAS